MLLSPFLVVSYPATVPMRGFARCLSLPLIARFSLALSRSWRGTKCSLAYGHRITTAPDVSLTRIGLFNCLAFSYWLLIIIMI